MAFGRLEEHQTAAERLAALALPLAITVAPWIADYKFDLPTWAKLLPVAAYVLIWAPAKVYSNQHDRITELEEELEPALSLAAEIRLGDEKLIGGLVVRNQGNSLIRACTAYLKGIEIRTDNGRCPASNQVATFLTWSLGHGAGKYADFHSEAHLDVLHMIQPYSGQFRLATSRETKPYLDVWLKESDVLIFEIEIGAENSPPITKHFEFVVKEKKKHAVADGHGGLICNPFPQVTFQMLD